MYRSVPTCLQTPRLSSVSTTRHSFHYRRIHTSSIASSVMQHSPIHTGRRNTTRISLGKHKSNNAPTHLLLLWTNTRSTPPGRYDYGALNETQRRHDLKRKSFSRGKKKQFCFAHNPTFHKVKNRSTDNTPKSRIKNTIMLVYNGTWHVWQNKKITSTSTQ